jgi:hypothetical protein
MAVWPVWYAWAGRVLARHVYAKDPIVFDGLIVSDGLTISKDLIVFFDGLITYA